MTGLAGFTRRGPGTTPSGAPLAGSTARSPESAAGGVRVETFWCRPNWAPAHAWHVTLALLGSFVAAIHPTIGTVLLGIVLISTAADATHGPIDEALERLDESATATDRDPTHEHGREPARPA